ncbi:MAG: hypothetical protein ACK2U9_06065 [Anaerolineae bacterium]
MKGPPRLGARVIALGSPSLARYFKLEAGEGVLITEVFPGTEVGGPGFVKAILGPMPWTRIMPTGGVDATEESIRAWFGAGVACVGIGSRLISRQLVAAGDFGAISAKVTRVLAWIDQARSDRA